MSETTKTYSLHKSRNILKWVYSWYKKHVKTVPAAQLQMLEGSMAELDQSLLQKDRQGASRQAQTLEKFASANCKRSLFSYAWELVAALAFALVIATIVRQMWFEPYEIPTGSMRPTFREQDRLTVTKTAFGINYPLETKHLYFDPSLVQRTSVVIFSGDGLPVPDVDTISFGIFPYKKRYIKRLIAKPGDSIYFYGGRLYGVDKDGNDIPELRDAPWMQTLEYVPYLSFHGEAANGGPQTVLLRQMHIPYGKLTFGLGGYSEGEVFNGKTWVKDDPTAQTKPHSEIQTYSDIFGFRNYAEARLLTKEELVQQMPDAKDIPEGVLYLQLHHTPSLTYPKATLVGNNLNIPAGYTTVIPLQQKHLDAIMDNMYTARFVVANGKGRRYSIGETRFMPSSPAMPNVPDGTYELYFGKATELHWGAVPTDVPKDSPLYSHDPANVQRMFNLGIEMETEYSPTKNNANRYPHRYAYFRDGDLYLMGASIVKKDDPTLAAFNKAEEQRQSQSTARAPYVAFKDYGPPMVDGKIDKDFIRTFGVNIPEGQYLVLGDNHAMSSDSRVFGFVPQNNLQGAPYWIVWPPGDRLGPPAQKPYPFMNLPRAIVWGIAGFIGLCFYLYHRWRLKQPIFRKIDIHGGGPR